MYTQHWIRLLRIENAENGEKVKEKEIRRRKWKKKTHVKFRQKRNVSTWNVCMRRSRGHTHTQPISYFALKSISERDAQNILFRILQSSKCNRINLCHVINDSDSGLSPSTASSVYVSRMYVVQRFSSVFFRAGQFEFMRFFIAAKKKLWWVHRSFIYFRLLVPNFPLSNRIISVLKWCKIIA